jgi:hypothetical protein
MFEANEMIGFLPTVEMTLPRVLTFCEAINIVLTNAGRHIQIGLDHRLGQSHMKCRPRRGRFCKTGKLFERQRVLAGLEKNALAWPER